MDSSFVFFVALTCLAGLSTAQPGSGPDKFQRIMFDFARMLETNATWRAEYEKSVAEEAKMKTFNYDFTCTTIRDSITPKTIHELRPKDINVIASLGDSITAGNGIDAWTAVTVLREKRGESWSVGGDKTLLQGVHTIGNVVRMFNPGLKGYSLGYGGESTRNAWLNVAVPGAKAEDVPGEVDMLIKKMKDDPRVDFDYDWKLITLLIGGNDLCDYCEDRMRYSPTMYGTHVRTALDKLHAQVPRALVNLVPMADVTPIPTIKTGPLCTVLHWSMCNCARNELTASELKPTQVLFYEQLKALADGGRYDTRDDFTVVLQPHLFDQEFPRDPKTGKYDPSYIAPDCFHPNRKAHQGLAYLLWNTMLTPVGQKPTSTDLSELVSASYKCPTKEFPYILTNKNSPKPAPKPSMLHKILHASKDASQMKAKVTVTPKP